MLDSAQRQDSKLWLLCFIVLLLIVGSALTSSAAQRTGVALLIDDMLSAKRYVEAAKILRESIRDLETQSNQESQLLEQYTLLADAFDGLDQVHPAIDALQSARKVAASLHGQTSGTVKKIDARIEALRHRPRRPKAAKGPASGTPRLITVAARPGTGSEPPPGGGAPTVVAIPGAGSASDEGSANVSVSSVPPAGMDAAMLKDASDLLQSGRLTEAQRLIDEALKANPNSVNALVLKADVCAKSNNLGAALEASERAVQVAPDHPAANFLYGSSLFVSQRYEEAARALEHTLAVAPTFSAAYLPLGSAYVQTDRYDDALSVFNKAKDATPDDPKVRTMLGNLLVLMDRSQEAVEELNFAIEKEPKNAQSRFYLGLAQLNSGNRPEAEAQLAKLKELSPELAEQLKRHLGQK